MDPGEGGSNEYQAALFSAVEIYLARGWKLFVIPAPVDGRKVSSANCDACDAAGRGHDMDACMCLLCHGFHAATDDPARLALMFGRNRGGSLALRTGAASGITVVDVDTRVIAGLGDGEHTGLDTLDQWETWVDGGWSLPPTMRARTRSGGFHLFYATGDDDSIASRAHVLPGIDVKSRDGYVVLPPEPGSPRAWLPPGRVTTSLVQPPSEQLLDWLRKAPGRRASGGTWGGSSNSDGALNLEVLGNGGPKDGQDEFISRWIFRLYQIEGVTSERELVERVFAEVRTWPLSDQRWPWTEDIILGKVQKVMRKFDPPEELPTWRPAVQGHDGVVTGGDGFTSGSDNVTHVDFTRTAGDGAGAGAGSDEPPPASPPPSSGDADAWSDSGWDPAERATDLGNGLRFVRIHARRARYVARNQEWLIWDGRVAAPNQDGLAIEMTRDVIADIYRHAEVRPAGMGDEAFENHRQAWGSWGVKSESLDRRTAMLKSAEKNRSILLDVDDLDPDPHALNTPSGLVDLHTGEVRPSRFVDLCTKITNVEYDPTVRDSAELDLFFETFMPDEENQRFTFALLGRTLHAGNLTRVFPIILGGTTSGKSQLLTLMHDVLGAYASAIGPSVLRGNLDDKPRPDLIKAMHTRIAIATEASKKWVLHADQIKRLTGGDPMPYRGMFDRKIIETVPRFTPVLVTNELPSIPDADAALKRRIAVLAFDRTLAVEKVDPAVKDRFHNDPRTRQAVLTRLIEGARDPWAESLSNMPARYSLATLGALGDLDHVGQFVQWIVDDGALVTVPDDVALRQCVRLKDLYEWYRTWLRRYAGPDERGSEVSYKDFNRRLRDVGWESAEAGGARWRGRALTREMSLVELA